MNPDKSRESDSMIETGDRVPDMAVAEQVLEVYEAASPGVRSRMLSQLVVNAFESASPLGRRHLLKRLLRPLGLLSLAAIAGGIFAKIRLRSTWPDVQVQIEDVQNVSPGDLLALVDHVQQVSVEAVTGVAQVIAASQWMSGSTVAAVLLTVMLRHSRAKKADDDDEDFPAAPA